MPAVYKRVRTSTPGASGRRAVFLDRDGVVIEDSGYLWNPDEIRYIEGSLGAVVQLNRAGIPVVLVTNQSGVGRGLYGWEDFERVQAAIELELDKAGGWLDGVWACGYHEDAIGRFHEDDDRFRKPNPGMIEDAARELGLAVECSWMVGDRVTDVEAGIRAGVAEVIQITPERVNSGETQVACGKIEKEFSLRTCTDLTAAVDLILSDTRNERQENAEVEK